MSQRFRYSVLGLVLECSRPLPRLAVEPAAEGETLELELGSAPRDLAGSPDGEWRTVWRTDLTDDRGQARLRLRQHAAGDFYQLAFSDGTRFFADHEGRRVWALWAEAYTLEDVESYFFSTVLGFVLRLRGIIALHASAVVIDGQAVALAGPPQAGKSTTAAAFALRGFAVLSDDITVLRPSGDGYLVPPGRPELRLWQRSSEVLAGLPAALPRLSASWDKRFLDLESHGCRGAGRPHPLAAIYLLDWRPESSGQLEITELAGSSGLVALAANSYVAHLLDRQMRATEFDFLTQLLGRLPVRRLTIPTSGPGPAEIRDRIIADFRRVSTAAERA